MRRARVTDGGSSAGAAASTQPRSTRDIRVLRETAGKLVESSGAVVQNFERLKTELPVPDERVSDLLVVLDGYLDEVHALAQSLEVALEGDES